MFAHRITFGPSLFSPHKKPRIVHYGVVTKKIGRAKEGASPDCRVKPHLCVSSSTSHSTGAQVGTAKEGASPDCRVKPHLCVSSSSSRVVTKKIIKHLPTVPTGEAAVNILSIDSLVLVMMAVYEVSTTAPLCAAVSRAFKQAMQQAEKNCKAIDVAPHRRHMKVAELPSLLPSVSEDDAAIALWGKNLESYEPQDGLQSCSKSDLERVLDLKGTEGGGWLSNFAVDTYLSTLMPRVGDAVPGARRVFFQGVHSIFLQKNGSLGFYCEDESGKMDLDRTNELRAKVISVLSTAEEIYVNYNLENYHWALIRVLPKYHRCEIFDSTGHTKKEHGIQLLAGLQELTKVDTNSWGVVVYEKMASGMAQQKDGKSCGVFLCITAAHLVRNAKLPDIQAKVVAWRRHIAARAFAAH